MRSVKHILLVLFLAVGAVQAQQGMQHTQFTVNRLGHNPAFAGLTKCPEFIVGYRQQWANIQHSPVNQFFGVDFPLGKRIYSFKARHAGAIYMEQESAHLTKKTYLKLAYSYQKRVSKTFTASFGIFGGIQYYSFSKVFDHQTNDPVLSQAGKSFIGYPDLMPGIILYNKKVIYSFAINQLFYKKNDIGGSENYNVPQYYFMHLHKTSYNNFDIQRALLVKANFLAPPSIDIQGLFTYRKKVSAGIGYRIGEAITGQLRFQLMNSISLGYAIEQPQNKFKGINTLSHEVVFRFSKCGETAGAPAGKRSTHSCPSFD